MEVEKIRFPVWLQGTEIREIFRNFKDFCRTFLLLGNNKPNMLDMLAGSAFLLDNFIRVQDMKSLISHGNWTDLRKSQSETGSQSTYNIAQ